MAYIFYHFFLINVNSEVWFDKFLTVLFWYYSIFYKTYFNLILVIKLVKMKNMNENKIYNLWKCWMVNNMIIV